MAKRTLLILSLTLVFNANPLVSLSASPAPSIKRSKSDRDIDAVGHRDILQPQVRKFIGSPEKEKERGAAWASAVDRSTKLIDDPALTGFLAAMAQKVGRNSDAEMPITVTVIDSDEVNACTSPGGYQYVTRGLLLQLESESELAALLAHGIAHSALHSPTIQGTRQLLMQMSGASPFGQDTAVSWFTCTSPPFRLFNGMRPTDEYNADYFGVQYVYKAGYDVDSYIRFVQRIWAAPLSANAVDVLAFIHFPPASERVKALRHEIADILPQRGEATLSTSAFEEFEEHLHIWRTEHPDPPKPKLPVLRRADENQ